MQPHNPICLQMCSGKRTPSCHPQNTARLNLIEKDLKLSSRVLVFPSLNYCTIFLFILSHPGTARPERGCQCSRVGALLPGTPTSACTIYTSSVQSFIDAKVLQLRFKALNSCAQIYLKDPPWSPYVLNCQRGQNWQLAQPAGDVTVSLWR